MGYDGGSQSWADNCPTRPSPAPSVCLAISPKFITKLKVCVFPSKYCSECGLAQPQVHLLLVSFLGKPDFPRNCWFWPDPLLGLGTSGVRREPVVKPKVGWGQGGVMGHEAGKAGRIIQRGQKVLPTMLSSSLKRVKRCSRLPTGEWVRSEFPKDPQDHGPMVWGWSGLKSQDLFPSTMSAFQLSSCPG